MRFLGPVFFLFLYFTLGCTGNAKKSELALLYLRMGTANLVQGQKSQALRNLLQAEELAPENAVIQNNLGLTYFVHGDLKNAEKHLRQAVSLRSDYSDAANNLGRLLIEQNNFAEARLHLIRARDDLTYESREKAYANLGLLEFRTQNYDQALTTLEAAIEIRRDYCLAHNFYGRTLFEKGQWVQASLALDRATSFCRKLDFDEPHYYSALSYFKRGDWQNARARFMEVQSFYQNGKYRKNATEFLSRIKK